MALLFERKFKDSNMSKAKLRKTISLATGCSKKAAEKRINAVVEKGGSIQYCLDNGLFELKAPQLSRFLGNGAFREYVEEVASNNDARGIDAYRQMQLAKEQYGIPYADFVKFNFFNKGEKCLIRQKAIRDKKERELYEKLAKAMDVSIEDAMEEAERIKRKFSISPKAYYRRRFYSKTDEEISEILDKKRKANDDLINEIALSTGWTPEEVKRDIARCSAKFGIARGDYPILRCYELDDELLSTYGNARDSATLNRRHNDRDVSLLLSDKKRFNEYFSEFTKRKYWVNRDTSFQEFEDFVEGLDEAFSKPIDGSLGREAGIVRFVGKDLKALYDELMKRPQTLFEERVKQHHELDEFYDGSINTLRLFTILDEADDFHVFAAFVRFGANGSVVDNVAGGGVGCGVDPETGKICTPAMDHDGNFIFEHPNSGKRFMDFKFPHWEMALKLAEKALRKNRDLNYIGWDIAIREDDVVMIEGNARPDIGICQAFFNYSKTGIKPRYERFLNDRNKSYRALGSKKFEVPEEDRG